MDTNNSNFKKLIQSYMKCLKKETKQVLFYVFFYQFYLNKTSNNKVKQNIIWHLEFLYKVKR